MAQIINVDVNVIPVKSEWMSIDDFINLDPVPMQRFTEDRANRTTVKRMLSNFSWEQLEVAVAELRCDSEYLGTVYKAGWVGVVNGNTRKHYWKNKLSNMIPSQVRVTRYYFDSMEEVRKCYDTFDSMDATEKKQEKMYGILVRSFHYTPKSTKIEKGQIISALNIANHFYDPMRFNQSTLKAEDMTEQIIRYLDEIKAFDSICSNEKNWDQALVAAALMSLKKYGIKNIRLIEGLKRIDTRSRIMNDSGNRYDGITHINEEWKNHEKLKNKTTSWEKDGGMKVCVSFALYWITKWMEDEKLSQLGFNWASTAKTFFPTYTALNNFLQIANNTSDSLTTVAP